VTSLEERDGDFVFELEVTSNRPDWLSLKGIAREIAAITNAKVKSQKSKVKPKIQKDEIPLKINIENKKDCPLYTAKIIKDVKVGPSPDWLKKRLELVGCRSVNSVVDITNYVLFESGHPLHAFDLDKISQDTVSVRRAKINEKIITIDGEQRILNPDTLVIADGTRPIAIAGIMGGQDSEVIESTKNILLEVAVFSPVTVRRGRQALGIQSESAYRFERGVDSKIVEDASLRASALIQELAGGRCVLLKSSGKAKTESKNIGLDVSAVQEILGVNIAPVKIKQILNSLGFKIKTKIKNNFRVEVPSHRLDVNLEIDLIEEIARILGYESIPTSLPAVRPQPSIGQTQDVVSLIKNILVAMGLNEVITYSLIDKNLLHSFSREEESDAIEILNPLSKEQEILRPSLIPSLARCVAYNLNQKQGYINIFEIAKVFSGQKEKPEEELVLGIALCGVRSLWFGQGRIQDEVGFLHLKGILEALFQRLGIKKEEYRFISKNSYEFEVYVKEVKIGILRKLERAILDRLDIKNKQVFALEIVLEKIFAGIRLDKKFILLARYPGVSRDISLVLKEDLPVEQIIKVIVERGGKLLKEVETTGYYKGEQIEPGFKGLTISCLYSSAERTLTEAEINPLHASIIQALKEQLEVKIR
jgi:phenylalanyl-tRNA synthetase beta chain